MSAIIEKIKSTEARRSDLVPRSKRTNSRDAEPAVENENLWQQLDWRELNLVSSASTLRHWHD